MTAVVELSQRRIGLRFGFCIADDTVRYSIRDSSGERTIEIPYEAINLEEPAFVTLAATPLLKRLFGCTLLLLLMAAAVGAFDRNIAAIWVSIALVLLATGVTGQLTGFSRIGLKLFELQPYPPGAIGPMRIMDDGKGEQIIVLLRQARKAKFRRLYGKADLDADPSDEIARLTWLKDNDILSENEWQVEVDRAREAFDDSRPDNGTSSDEKPKAIH